MRNVIYTEGRIFIVILSDVMLNANVHINGVIFGAKSFITLLRGMPIKIIMIGVLHFRPKEEERMTISIFHFERFVYYNEG